MVDRYFFFIILDFQNFGMLQRCFSLGPLYPTLHKVNGKTERNAKHARRAWKLATSRSRSCWNICCWESIYSKEKAILSNRRTV